MSRNNIKKKTKEGIKYPPDLLEHKIKLGIVGKVIGDKEYAELNLVALTIILCFILVIAISSLLIFLKISQNQINVLQSLILFLTNLTALAFGYLFGIKGKQNAYN